MMNYQFNLLKVKGRLAELNLKQRDLAKVLGISEAHISRVFRGQYSFSTNDVCIIANKLQVDPSVFFTPTLAETEKRTR